ncbi:hypothetical protein OGAPHI_005236 [Ogataea philodendri]|uniref:Upf1 domain-containing protein n=1 Tax=Ogataea philodendri TaxID=1378263 RepID=A0A9P8P0Z5_9ASCO|nr:uncharacterized protein OGAPHI_005236 [Ogataea philodendri]KAH3663833.1 hypothetical protein OGAPHI_005236 [Ogataea philodendri]
MEDLPDRSCAYCGITSPDSLVHCQTCDKWFCNAKTSRAGSHIVTHMVFSKHQSLCLHPDSDFGETMLECYNCGNRNLFVLGFVSAKTDSVVVILCRLPCAASKNADWDTENWQSLVENRQLLPWMAKPPSEEEIQHARPITAVQISKLETKWRQDKDATLMDLDQEEVEEELEPILMRYSDAYQYQRAFSPLVQYEANYDKLLKQSQSLQIRNIEWSLGDNGMRLASFTLPSYDAFAIKLNVGDPIELKYSGPELGDPWQVSGYIVRVPGVLNNYFTAELLASQSDKMPVHISSGFTADLVWKGTSYDRMQKAMKHLAVNSKTVSEHVYSALLGIDHQPTAFPVSQKQNYSVPKSTKLNASQDNAIKSVLSKPFSLIQGPPGTGKTVTSANIVYQLAKRQKKPVLVCAPSNVAVDHLAAKLESLGLRVVRLFSKNREDVESSVQHLSLTEKVKSTAAIKGFYKSKDSNGKLSAADEKQLETLQFKEQRRLIVNSQVVCCTCVGAGDHRLDKLKFPSVLIDESTQASEPECLIPIVKGANQVVLVGDHQQLGPVILSRKAGDAGLKQSMFERLIHLGHIPIRLDVQYRMHPCLSEFSSNIFYDGSLQNGVSAESRIRANNMFPWPIREKPMMFWGVGSSEELGPSGTSYLNRAEAINCERAITRLFAEGVEPSQIGVITPYVAQKEFIVQYMGTHGTFADKSKYLEVEIASVDAFQGREKDYVILSCVRANDNQSIGFLTDPRRMNVALTRARYGMVILGNPRTLSKNSIWSRLLLHYRECGCLVEGDLDNLRLSNLQLQRSVPYRAREQGSSTPTSAGDLFGSQLDLNLHGGAQSWPKLGSELDTPANARSMHDDEIKNLAEQLQGKIRF